MPVPVLVPVPVSVPLSAPVPLVSIEVSVLLWRDTHHEIPLQRPSELAQTIHDHVTSLAL